MFENEKYVITNIRRGKGEDNCLVIYAEIREEKTNRLVMSATLEHCIQRIKQIV